jgi:protein O-GlcNAc transferase
MSLAPVPTAQILSRATALYQGGRLAEAESLYAAVLEQDPENITALQALGILALQQARAQDAVRCAAAWIRVQPGNAAAHALRGMAHAAAGQGEEALDDYQRALELQPNFTAVRHAAGNVLRDLGRHPQAIESYDRALLDGERHLDIIIDRAHTLLAAGRASDAAAGYGEALASRPDAVQLLLARGRALGVSGRPGDALKDYDRAFAIDPRSVDALNGRGASLRVMLRLEAALDSFDAALRLCPDHPSALNNYALTLHDLNRGPEAVVHLERALALRPDYPPALHNLGMILHSIDRHDEAARHYARLVAVSPDFDYAAGNLIRSRLACCDWYCHAQDAERVLESLASGAAAADPLTVMMLTDATSVQLACARRFTAKQYPASAQPLWRAERYRHDRIRVAYLSADFYDHPVSHLLAGVVERHDRTQFETFGVSLRREPRNDAMRERMRRAFEHFLDVSDLDDRDVAVRLRELEVDIAIDMAGPTRGGRLNILAARPAPIQVNYLGFAGSYGADYIDYLIADGSVIPPDQDRFYAERIIRLPHSFLPNDDRQAIANEVPRRSDVGLPETAFVFCGFNNAYKINPTLFAVWMRLLRQSPGSVLWLREGAPAMVANLRREAAARDVAPERLIFAPRVPSMDRHLARYRLADLFLDTVPYGAHSTARDALWAGIPVLTCVGQAFASRVAGSLLGALGLGELITDNLDAYAALGLKLARDRRLVLELRDKLARHRLTYPVFDTDRYRRDLESAYRILWERHQRGEPPSGLVVPAARGGGRASA